MSYSTVMEGLERVHFVRLVHICANKGGGGLMSNHVQSCTSSKYETRRHKRARYCVCGIL